MTEVVVGDDFGVWGVQLAVISVLLVLLLRLPALWSLRKIIVSVAVALIGTSTGFLVLSLPGWIGLLLFAIQTYRLFSLLRIAEDRMEIKRLRSKVLRTDLYLSLQLATLLGFYQFIYTQLADYSIIPLLVALQLLVGVVFYRHARHMYKDTMLKLPKKFTPDVGLPTLTVAIPARNETAGLADCLHTLLASDYPKLEVLVLDDCSQDKTSEVIKDFAHDGVRFVKGTLPPEGWVAKNYAYDTLLKNASGQFVLFCGIDVRFEIDSLRKLMNIIVNEQLNMVSVLPVRSSIIDRNLLLQPMRYWHELVLPRRADGTPPVLSTCWVASRPMLLRHGGFKALKRAIRPERFIARGVNQKGNYRFVRASAGLGISSNKDLSAQWQTASRTRYPELHSRPESVWLSSLWHAVFLLGPIVSIAYGAYVQNVIIIGGALAAYLYLLASHYYVHLMTTGSRSLRPLLLYPTSVVLELVALNYSMWAYEFSEVIWKGRNVCIPTLRVTPRLPKA